MKILTADIGGTSTKVALCDELGRLEQFKEYATGSEQGGPFLMEKLLEQLASYSDYDAVAVSTAGQVNADEGYIVFANANIPGYTGTRIADIIGSRFGKPVKVENDVNAAALGEAHFGAGQPYNDFLCLTYGTGVGGAIVMDRRVYRGANGVAGEFGHMLTRPSADRSGGSGEGKPFYESKASTTALIRAARAADPECVDGRVLFDKINNGNHNLLRILQDWAAEVAAGLASLIHIFNPPAIIVGGGVMEQDSLVHLVEQRTKELIMESFAGVRIQKASLGNKAGLLGAASLFLR